ncbi:hypothetical protein BV22DRAFT_1127798 [Leucogyrophana mollusca]|uniref:Uncharacterized protein n=1 Tax=Leucogyrophana mollusca TaxID=85980 RepID=A0ACB8BLY0_9AGAM|nr:hypothetical protein BV22DRAFT_1127798 [Leucogyrophana mollusca]
MPVLNMEREFSAKSLANSDDEMSESTEHNASSESTQLGSEAFSPYREKISPEQTRNIIIFGETGAGKSALINLIVGGPVADTSPDAQGCTLDTAAYPFTLAPHHFELFDTVGLNEPQLGKTGYLDAIEKAYRLVSTLTKQGGIHLLVFCIRGGRITTTTEQNYRLFNEFLCHRDVPVALVITGLELEDRMEDWWVRNEEALRGFGMKSVAHACVTATLGVERTHVRKYENSRNKLLELLREHGTGQAFAQERIGWIARLMKDLRGLLRITKPQAKKPSHKDMVKILRRRCRLPDNDAAMLMQKLREIDLEAGS